TVDATLPRRRRGAGRGTVRRHRAALPAVRVGAARQPRRLPRHRGHPAPLPGARPVSPLPVGARTPAGFAVPAGTTTAAAHPGALPPRALPQVATPPPAPDLG